MQENIRRIDTNIYGDIAYRFLYSICPAKSDFLANLGSGLCLGRYKRFIQICRDPNNLIYITINDPCVSLENRADWLKSENISTYIFDKTDAQILSWLATRIKLYLNKKVQHHDWFYEKDDNVNNITKLKISDKWWNDTNGYVISSLHVNHDCKEDECTTIADLYNICQSLKGKKKIKNRDRILGKPLTDDEILNAKCIAEMKDKLVNEYHIQQCKLCETYHQKLKDEYDNLKKEYTDKLHAIDPTCEASKILNSCHSMITN
jgi:hypothetical protein